MKQLTKEVIVKCPGIVLALFVAVMSAAGCAVVPVGPGYYVAPPAYYYGPPVYYGPRLGIGIYGGHRGYGTYRGRRY